MLGLILTALAAFAAGCFVGARVMGGFMLSKPKQVTVSIPSSADSRETARKIIEHIRQQPSGRFTSSTP